jgi:hypothetical protein
MNEDLVKSLTFIRPEVFERNLFNALAANRNLLTYAPFYLYREVSKAAALGLLLDPPLGGLHHRGMGRQKKRFPAGSGRAA